MVILWLHRPGAEFLRELSPKAKPGPRGVIQVPGPGIRTGAVLPRLQRSADLGQERIPESLLHVSQQGRGLVAQEAEAGQQQVEGGVCLQELRLCSCSLGRILGGVSATRTQTVVRGGRFPEQLLQLRFRKAASACYRHSEGRNTRGSNLDGEKGEATATRGGVKGLTGLLKARLAGRKHGSGHISTLLLSLS